MRFSKWAKVVLTPLTVALWLIGLGGVPEDIQTWGIWLKELDSEAGRWIVVLSATAVLLAVWSDWIWERLRGGSLRTAKRQVTKRTIPLSFDARIVDWRSGMLCVENQTREEIRVIASIGAAWLNGNRLPIPPLRISWVDGNNVFGPRAIKSARVFMLTEEAKTVVMTSEDGFVQRWPMEPGILKFALRIEYPNDYIMADFEAGVGPDGKIHSTILHEDRTIEPGKQ